MPVSSPDKPELLTTTEAGALAGKSSETIRRAVRDGEIPVAKRVGNAVLLDRAAVEAWAKRREHGAKGGAV